MTDRTMHGIFPILATPFDADGRINVEDVEREVEWLIENGVSGIGIAIASEIYKLDGDDRDLLLTTVVRQAAGRVKIVMNTGADGTDVGIARARRAQDLGADALMVWPPSFIPVPAEEVVEYFRRIAESVGIPIFQQDQAGAPIPPALAVRLARAHENLCYAKVETPPTVPRVAEAAALRGDSGLILFGGAGGVFLLEEARRGSVGSMPGAALPDVFVRAWETWHSGPEHEAKAEAGFRRYAALLRTMGQGQGIGTWLVKHTLARRGVIRSAYPRHPARRPDDATLRELDRLLDDLELSAT